MSKTVDELVGIYFRAANASTFPQYETPNHRAGIAAVVRALRDEIVGYQWAENKLNEILGSDAGDEVAGGSTREDGRSVEQLGATASHAITTPATAPAPAVCGWKPQEYFTHNTSCGSGQRVDPRGTSPVHCPSCDKPIKFTEAQR